MYFKIIRLRLRTEEIKCKIKNSENVKNNMYNMYLHTTEKTEYFNKESQSYIHRSRGNIPVTTLL